MEKLPFHARLWDVNSNKLIIFLKRKVLLGFLFRDIFRYSGLKKYKIS